MPGMHIILSEIIIMIYVMSEHWYLGTPKSVSSLVHWLLNLWFFFSMIKIECHLFVIQYICFAFHRIHYIWLASINGQSAFIALSHRIKSKSFEYSNHTKRSIAYCIGSSNSRSSSSIFIHFFFYSYMFSIWLSSPSLSYIYIYIHKSVRAHDSN